MDREDRQEIKKEEAQARSMRSVEIQRNAAALLEFYKSSFQETFGDQPQVDLDQAMVVCRSLVMNVGVEKSRALLIAFLHMKDDWFQGQGYSLECFKNNVNKVIVKSGVAKERLPQFVVSLQKDGFPVLCSNRQTMGPDHWFKPAPFEEWKSQTIEQKLQYPAHLFKNDPVAEWIANWKEWGYVK